jgi:pyruvate/2-oxoacid:ferredoxin oxidoreductase beta subunit
MSVMGRQKIVRVGTAFDTVASTASGLRKALDKRGDTGTTVIVWAGDGATFDAGFIGLSACAERNEDILFICYDNEAYMNTGNQRSSATPWGANTYTTPGARRKMEEKKNVVEILASHYVPYAATASIAYVGDLQGKLVKAKGIKGFRFIHIYSPCPTGWTSDSERSIELSRLVVESRAFPLYEVEDGERYTITVNPEPVLIEKYLAGQGRYKTVTPEDIRSLQDRINRRWRILEAKTRH